MNMAIGWPNQKIERRDPRPFWTTSTDDTLGSLASRADGLTSQEASERLVHYGANVIDARVRQSIAAKLARRLIEPLTAILLLSAAISGATGDWQSFVIIVLIVALSIVLDVFQEHKAESAIDALKRSVAVTASVRRDGRIVARCLSETLCRATWCNCRPAQCL